jgi:hypothetical protein
MALLPTFCNRINRGEDGEVLPISINTMPKSLLVLARSFDRSEDGSGDVPTMHKSGREEYGTAEEMERAAAEWAERERKVDHVAAALQVPATPVASRLDLRQYAKQLTTEMKSGSRACAYQSTDEDDSDAQDDDEEIEESEEDSDGHGVGRHTDHVAMSDARRYSKQLAHVSVMKHTLQTMQPHLRIL